MTFDAGVTRRLGGGTPVRPLHLTYEAVTAFRKRLNITGIVGGVAQSLANLIYCGGQAVFEINKGIRRP